MLRSIATVSISGTLPEKLHAIAAAGYQGVEIFENDLLYYTGTPAEIRQLAADLGLKITLFQPFRDFEGASRAQFAANMARARRKFALMRELGCETLLLCSNVQPDCSADSELQVADLRALATLAEEEGIAIGYEALAWGTHVNRWQQAWERVRRGLCLFYHSQPPKKSPIPYGALFFIKKKNPYKKQEIRATLLNKQQIDHKKSNIV